MKNFEKNDDEFICRVCGNFVPKLKYTSRDHCNNCLCSLHVDINPGDRQNTCGGILIPVDITQNQKGYVVKYICNQCGQTHNNKTASDDKFSTILKVMNKSYNIKEFNKQ